MFSAGLYYVLSLWTNTHPTAPDKEISRETPEAGEAVPIPVEQESACVDATGDSPTCQD